MLIRAYQSRVQVVYRRGWYVSYGKREVVDSVAGSTAVLDDASRRRMAELARAHKAVLDGVARRLCQSRDDAEDLVQDALERAMRNADKLTDPGRARAWLITVMHNLFIDRCRHKSRRPHHGALDEDHLGGVPDPGRVPAWGDITVDDVRAAARDLPGEFRRAYEMHAFEKRSYEDIARALGVPKSTVGTRLLRARRKLRALLAKRHRLPGEEQTA